MILTDTVTLIAHDTDGRKQPQRDTYGPPTTHLTRSNQHYISEASILGKIYINPSTTRHAHNTSPDPHISLTLNTMKIPQHDKTLNMSTDDEHTEGTEAPSGPEGRGGGRRS